MKIARKKSEAGMIDISEKAPTVRVAIASGYVQMSRKAFVTLQTAGSPKGDVFATAKVAGILAAKSTPSIIPLCHPLLLTGVTVSFEPEIKKSRIRVVACVKAQGQTGVEMEALCAVSCAALTIYDMMKWADKSIEITGIALDEKQGGKSGTYIRKK